MAPEVFVALDTIRETMPDDHPLVTNKYRQMVFRLFIGNHLAAADGFMSHGFLVRLFDDITALLGAGLDPLGRWSPSLHISIQQHAPIPVDAEYTMLAMAHSLFDKRVNLAFEIYDKDIKLMAHGNHIKIYIDHRNKL